MSFLTNLFARAEPVLSEATARDTPAIAALHAASFARGWSEDEVERLLSEHSVLTHRAMAGSALAGFIMSRIAADEAEILSVAVDKSFRARGLSKILLALHMRRLAWLGVRTIFLEVGETNDPAAQLYAGAGFEEVARRANYYDDGSGRTTDAVVLRRDLF